MERSNTSETHLEFPVEERDTGTFISKLSGLTTTWEAVVIAVLAVVAVFSRLWILGARVLSHDESLHAYFSWLLATGKGYAHNPMMHGPFLFEATALIDRLFGATDFTTRLIPAIAGVLIAIVIPRLFKPWLGRAGALAASALLVISPYVLYYSRYIRHDILEVGWVLLAVYAIFRYLETQQDRYLILLAVALALMLSTLEISFFYLAILVSYLFLRGIYRFRLDWRGLIHSAEMDLVVVVMTLGAFFSSPIALLVVNPLWKRFTGSPFVDLNILDTWTISWSSTPAGIRLWGLLAVFATGSVIVGLLWGGKRWLMLAGIFLLITTALFTTLGTNLAGLGTGLVGSLGYWLTQQGVDRGAQPVYYYLIVFPLYEYLPIFCGICAGIYYLLRRKTFPAASREFIPFLVWWAVLIFAAVSLAGEKMPWISLHIAIPVILLSGWWIGRLLEMGWSKERAGRMPWFNLARGAVLASTAILFLLTVRTSYLVNYVNYDYTTEYMDYAHGAPGVNWTMQDIATIAQKTGAGQNLKVAYDEAVAWPLTWYLRNDTNQAFYGSQPTPQTMDAPVIIAGPADFSKVESALGDRYVRFQVIRLWWPDEDYKNLTWQRIRYALTNPAMRSALWSILWDRNYGPYAQLTSQQMNPPASWPLNDPMRIYIRKDIVAQVPTLKLSPYHLSGLASNADPYAGVRQTLPASQLFTLGLQYPSGLAVAPDGSIYIADTGNNRILHLDPNGKLLASWGSKTPAGQASPQPGTFSSPSGIAVDSQGNVYVADTWNYRIQKFDPNGKFLLQWGQPGQAKDGPGRLWGPRGVAVDNQGRVYVTDTGNKRVIDYDSNGKLLLIFQSGGVASLNEPVGISIGPDGRVYVADTWNQRVAVFDLQGQFIDSWPIQAWYGSSLDDKPYLAVDSQNHVVLTDPEGYRVLVFSSSGKSLAEFGQYGAQNDAFGLPSAVAVNPDGTLWISDAVNNRIGVYNLDGLLNLK